MAVHDILSQDEVDALLNGLGGDDIQQDKPELDEFGKPRRYDFGNE